MDATPAFPTGNRLVNSHSSPPFSPRHNQINKEGLSPFAGNNNTRNNNRGLSPFAGNNNTRNNNRGLSPSPSISPPPTEYYNNRSESLAFLDQRPPRKSPSTRKQISTATNTLKKQFLEAMKTVDRIGKIACTGGRK